MRNIQGWGKEWSLGCVNPDYRLPRAAGREFMQPRDHSFSQLCTARYISQHYM